MTKEGLYVVVIGGWKAGFQYGEFVNAVMLAFPGQIKPQEAASIADRVLDEEAVVLVLKDKDRAEKFCESGAASGAKMKLLVDC